MIDITLSSMYSFVSCVSFFSQSDFFCSSVDLPGKDDMLLEYSLLDFSTMYGYQFDCVV